jgi:hypothetical protein
MYNTMVYHPIGGVFQLGTSIEPASSALLP